MAACLKIIACGRNTKSVDRDDLDASLENKGSDRRGWSFRKRSARHQALSNTIITEIPSSDKEISEPVIVNSEEPIHSTETEKISGIPCTEEIPRVSTSSVLTKADGDDDIECNPNPDESVVVVIQTAVRGLLARRELLRHKNVVKLQAAVRGHLIRSHALGTFRCVQGIIKMQALVRARHASLSAGKSSVGKKGPHNSGTESYISIEKLHSNKFARQLLESTPRTKKVKIKCDPSRSDLAWQWLERWTSVSSPPTMEQHAHEPVETVIPSHCGSKKASNPAFIAAQSKFEELTSKTNSLKSTISSNQDLAVESLASYGSQVVQTGGSECNTELSITSTLDSPDQAEVGTMEELEKKVKVFDEKVKKHEKVLSEKQENGDGGDEEQVKPVNSADISQKLHKSSLEASPRSHITFHESQGTPSSQVSTNTRNTRSEKKVQSPSPSKSQSQRRKSWSNSKKLTGSDIRSSLELLPKDPKPGKRRNSFGSPKQDPRDSSSNSNSLPSYMQATESARAKALANMSARLSPDVQDKEIYMKKRYSLPGAVNVKEISPRIERSMSQIHLTAKAYGYKERKWQRF